MINILSTSIVNTTRACSISSNSRDQKGTSGAEQTRTGNRVRLAARRNIILTLPISDTQLKIYKINDIVLNGLYYGYT